MPRDILKEFAPIFYPKSHAIIGASTDIQKYGGRFLSVLLSFGYKGKVYPVNPQENHIFELKVYPRSERVQILDGWYIPGKS